jgi:glycerol-3-phosphate dehydrogenase
MSKPNDSDRPGAPTREELLERLKNETFDVVVVGGGATGLGAAVDAMTRGYSVALLEARDWAAGTSSRSTKLAHGGVRYLAQFDFGLVRDALRERGLMVRNAPHLVHPLSFIVPAYHRWELGYYGVGLRLYDALAGRGNLKRSRLLSARTVREAFPLLKTRHLRGGIEYTDGQFEDSRLAITLLRTALDGGVAALNYSRVRALVKPAGRVVGAAVEDIETGETYEVRGKAVLNATGVFADRLRRMDDPEQARLIRPSQGIHIVLPGKFAPKQHAILVPRTDDGRVLFLIPWLGHALVGTTDTPVDEIGDEPMPLKSEVAYVLEHVSRYASEPATARDIRGVFAGLRPLVARQGSGATASLSRDHHLEVSPSGLVTITGGKWTTYRKMAQDAVDAVAEAGSLPRRPSQTHDLRLAGGVAVTADVVETFARATGIEPAAGRRLLHDYGSLASEVVAAAQGDASLLEPVHPDLPYLKAEVLHAVRNEQARGVDDVMTRRTRALFLNLAATAASATEVSRLIARELRQKTATTDDLEDFRELLGGLRSAIEIEERAGELDTGEIEEPARRRRFRLSRILRRRTP